MEHLHRWRAAKFRKRAICSPKIRAANHYEKGLPQFRAEFCKSFTRTFEFFTPYFQQVTDMTPETPKPLLYPQGRTGARVPPLGRPMGPPARLGATMSTLRQIEANRRNAQKSTGPTSVTGKATSSMNALKTGIYGQSLVLPSENLADLDQLTEDYYQHHQPATPDARCFVDDLIYCEWLLRRLRAAETQAWQYQSDNKYSDPQKYPLGQS